MRLEEKNNLIVENLYNADFAKKIMDSNVQLLDVRTEEEYKEVKIPNSINIDVTKSDFFDKIESLDKSRPIAVYCRSGQRSFMAAQILASRGFIVSNLQNGLLNWNGQTE